MASHGGIRIGSGRPAGSKNRATADIKEGLSGLAKNHTVEALGVIISFKGCLSLGELIFTQQHRANLTVHVT